MLDLSDSPGEKSFLATCHVSVPETHIRSMGFQDKICLTTEEASAWLNRGGPSYQEPPVRLDGSVDNMWGRGKGGNLLDKKGLKYFSCVKRTSTEKAALQHYF